MLGHSTIQVVFSPFLKSLTQVALLGVYLAIDRLFLLIGIMTLEMLKRAEIGCFPL